MDTDTLQTQQAAELDPQQQQKAREYALIRRRLSYINMAIAGVGIVFIFWTELNIGLRDQLVSLNWQPLAGWYPLQILVFFLILMLGYQIIHAPLAYYGGFVLPHRY